MCKCFCINTYSWNKGLNWCRATLCTTNTLLAASRILSTVVETLSRKQTHYTLRATICERSHVTSPDSVYQPLTTNNDSSLFCFCVTIVCYYYVYIKLPAFWDNTIKYKLPTGSTCRREADKWHFTSLIFFNLN